MKSTPLFRSTRLARCTCRTNRTSPSLLRHSSTDTAPVADLATTLQKLTSDPPQTVPTADLEASLQELKSRPANETYQYLTNTNSHLLNLALADFLPESCNPRGFSKSNLRTPKISRGDTRANDLALGHHLVNFAPQVLQSDLLPDGTDSLHFPGAPFVRRLWTGGSLSFNRNAKWALQTDSMSALCKEEISKVEVKGQPGTETIWVTIQRRIGGTGKTRESRQFPGKPDREWGALDRSIDSKWGMKSALGKLSLVETRNLVFLRAKSRKDALRDASMSMATAMKRLMPAHEPDFRVSVMPTQALLFRFSALTFNAHRIHLDPLYCREVEGHRNTLVHGPLSVVLMLSVLRSQLKEGEMVLEFEYRNLVPLYAEEEMTICVRRHPQDEQKMDVWIEGKGGGYAVKGFAMLGKDYEIVVKSLRLTPDSGDWLKHRSKELRKDRRVLEREQRGSVEGEAHVGESSQPTETTKPRRSYRLDLGRGIDKPGYH